MHNIVQMSELALDFSEFKGVDPITLFNTVVGILSLLLGAYSAFEKKKVFSQ
jgi:hypothetical protein